ncbi:MAG TPA: isoprenylcysteine carboxylmethyltransferase family protein [Acidobacteriaceae bacterium]|nr:isoprenylcysteine carboxylmethyltransferase family protein [Acidobacteriaceae bacterium]
MNDLSGRTPWQQITKRIRVPLGFLFAGIYFWFARPNEQSLLLSLILVVPGIALRAYASGYVKKNAELTVTGPYAYTRNPLYLGSMMIAFGFAAAARNLWITLALVVLFGTIYLPTILGEETYLITHFLEFDEYARSVPRLLPRVSPWVRQGETRGASQFSLALYSKHREYNSVLGSTILFLALIARMLWRH